MSDPELGAKTKHQIRWSAELYASVLHRSRPIRFYYSMKITFYIESPVNR